MAKRTGIPTMIVVAKRLCGLVQKYGTVIQLLYPDNTALIAALAAANAACQTLVDEATAVRELGD